ncbi:class I SAM-dependent methyltransferase [Streptomyces sp. WAC06614]|nr:class I SAM-dependent methyltransferase [Streptomyces sp. WAC06614]
MGRWSRRAAELFVSWLGCGPGLRWLDVGCGTGALTATVAARCRPRTVVGVERSAAFTAAARAAVPPQVGLAVADGQRLPVRDASFDVAVSGLVLNFLPAPHDAVAEAVRAVRPGGTVAAYVWAYGDGMDLLDRFWAAATAADPAAAGLDERTRFPLCRPEPLRRLWTGAGLSEVAVTPVEPTAVLADFTELWEPFLAGQGPAPGYVAALAPPARARLHDALRAAVPARPDGSITLGLRAWAVRGRTPAVRPSRPTVMR